MEPFSILNGDGGVQLPRFAKAKRSPYPVHTMTKSALYLQQEREHSIDFDLLKKLPRRWLRA